MMAKVDVKTFEKLVDRVDYHWKCISDLISVSHDPNIENVARERELWHGGYETGKRDQQAANADPHAPMDMKGGNAETLESFAKYLPRDTKVRLREVSTLDSDEIEVWFGTDRAKSKPAPADPVLRGGVRNHGVFWRMCIDCASGRDCSRTAQCGERR